MGDLERKVFNECYKFLIRHKDKRDWDTISAETQAIEKQFNCSLANNLLYACIKHMDELDEREGGGR